MTSTIITGLVLLVLNLYCAQFSQELFCQSKQLAMVEKAILTAEEIGNADVLTAETATETINRLGGPGATRLVITDAAGRVLYDSTGTASHQSYALFPQVIRALQGTDVFTWHYHDGAMQSGAATPIMAYDALVGCVYMMEYDTSQGALILSLQNNVFSITLILAVPCTPSTNFTVSDISSMSFTWMRKRSRSTLAGRSVSRSFS